MTTTTTLPAYTPPPTHQQAVVAVPRILKVLPHAPRGELEEHLGQEDEGEDVVDVVNVLVPRRLLVPGSVRGLWVR